MSYKYLDAAALRGKTITSIVQIGSDRIEMATDDGKRYIMHHSQDCCESVFIHDIWGKLDSLIGSPLITASEETSPEWPAGVEIPEYQPESYTWTIYRFAVEGHCVRIRWLGESNGWYSESVDIEEIE